MNSTKAIYKRIVSLFIVILVCLSAMPMYNHEVLAADTFETEIAKFPESYKPYLRELHKTYPKWKFVPYDTGLDFSEVVENEATNNKSLVEKLYNDHLKSRATGDYRVDTGAYIAKDGSSWVSASRNAVAYFVDPRNFLNENHITMFEQLSYDKTLHTKEGIEAVIAGSFMANAKIGYLTSAGKYVSSSTLYSTKILEAAIKSNVSPYYLASKIQLEVGKGKHAKYDGMGSGSSVNGQHATYPGIYNFYNIGASDGTDAVSNGLKWAKTGTTYMRPWTNPSNSIIGGAIYIGEKYINCGQDTTYFQRFNVRKNGTYALYTHQYMTSLYGNASESASTASAYKKIGIAEMPRTYVIPVYKNMPNENTTITYGNANKTGKAHANVNMRKGPNTGAEKVITLSTGDPITVIECVMTDLEYGVKWLSNPYWYKVKVSKDGTTYTGYVSANYVDISSEMNVIKGIPQKAAITTSNKETVYYATDDPAIATVDAEGNITGVKAGTTTLIAFTQCGKFSPVTVTVVDKGVVIKESKQTINLNETKKLTATVYPTNSTNKNITWSSSDTKVATVSKDGTVKGVSVGKATITAKADVGGAIGTCVVEIIKPVTGIKLNKTSATLSLASILELKATIEPADATKKDIEWKTSNKKIATVENGVVTPVSCGTVTITATSVEGKKTATCTVKVKPKKTKFLTGVSKGADSIGLTWETVDNATGYRLYRKTEGGSYKCIKVIKTNVNSFIDSGLVTGQNYTYKVAAYTVVDGSKYIASKSSTISVMPIPKRTKITSINSENKAGIVINWKEQSGADGYKLYRREGNKGSYKRIKTTKLLTYTDKKVVKGVKYYYKVKVYKKVNGKKIYSNYSKRVGATR